MRTITKDQARKEMADYIETNSDRTVYVSEIFGVLGIDIGMVMDILDELETAGVIERVDE